MDAHCCTEQGAAAECPNCFLLDDDLHHEFKLQVLCTIASPIKQGALRDSSSSMSCMQ